MQTNHRHYILLVFAILALGESVFGFVFLRNIILREAIKSSEIISETKSIEDKNKRAEGIASAYEKTVQDRTKLTSFLISNDKVVDLIEEIEKIGADTGATLELSNIAHEDLPKEGGFQLGYFTAHIDGHGEWSDVMRDFILLENMPYNVILSNIRFEESGESAAAELPVVVKKGKTATSIKAKQWRLTLDIKILTTK